MLNKFALFAVAVLPLAGCIISETPMSDPKAAKSDKSLIGDWVYRDAKGQKGYLHFGDGGIGLPLHWMEVINVKGKSDFSPSYDFGFPSEVGGHKYFNIVLLKSPVESYKDKKPDEILKDVTNYVVFKYEVSPNELTIWEADGKALEKATKTGTVKGDGIAIKDTAERFRKFVTDHDAELFMPARKTTCERLPE